MRARDALRRHGWTQERLRDKRTGRVCAIGAIATVRMRGAGEVATPHYPKPWERRYDAIVILAKSLGWTRLVGMPPNQFVVEWNDEPGRTSDEVADAFERAAVGL